MVIKNLSIDGFRDLYEILTSENTELAFNAMSGGLGPKGVEALNNIRVSADIRDLSLIEAIHMRDFASTFEGSTPKVEYEIAALDGESQAHIWELSSIMKVINNDPDVNISRSSFNHLLPIVCQRVDAQVTFSGYGLQNIIGLEGKKLFLNTNGIGDKTIYDEEKIKQMIEKMLVQKFFETMSRSLVSVDRETEYFLQSKYFAPAREKYAEDKTKMLQLLSVTSPVGSFSLRYDDANKIMRTAHQIKDWYGKRDHESNAVITRPRRETGLVEGIRMNFSVILNVYEALLLKYAYPELVQCSENLALQVGDNYIEIDPALHEKYYHRLEGPITSILKRRADLEDAFAHFNLIFGGQVMAMNISIPCIANAEEDLANYFMKIGVSPDYDINLLPLDIEIRKAYTMIMNIIKSA